MTFWWKKFKFPIFCILFIHLSTEYFPTSHFEWSGLLFEPWQGLRLNKGKYFFIKNTALPSIPKLSLFPHLSLDDCSRTWQNIYVALDILVWKYAHFFSDLRSKPVAVVAVVVLWTIPVFLIFFKKKFGQLHFPNGFHIFSNLAFVLLPWNARAL